MSDAAANQTIRPVPCRRSASRNSTTCAGASPRRGGRSERPSTTRRKACGSRRCRQLARYWATDYDWRKCEARLNALPQFVTEIDGLDIHFIHVRSKHDERAADHRHARVARARSSSS